MIRDARVLQDDFIPTEVAHRDPAQVVDRLRVRLAALDRGDVDPAALAVANRVSRERAAYRQYTRSVAALDRVADRGLERYLGEDVRYVVVDDDRDDRERVRLASESPDSYDPAFYRARAVRAAASVLSPFGWRRDRINDTLSAGGTARLDLY